VNINGTKSIHKVKEKQFKKRDPAINTRSSAENDKFASPARNIVV
jgi:hypothetical protein